MIKTWDDFDETLRRVALLEAKLHGEEQKRIEAVTKAETDCKVIAAPLVAERDALVEQLEGYYAANRKAVEADGKRSIELRFGRAGFRTGKPALKTLKGWTWEKVIGAVKERFGRKSAELLIVKEQPDKEALKKLDTDQQKAVGLKLVQEESFWYEVFPEKVD